MKKLCIFVSVLKRLSLFVNEPNNQDKNLSRKRLGIKALDYVLILRNSGVFYLRRFESSRSPRRKSINPFKYDRYKVLTHALKPVRAIRLALTRDLIHERIVPTKKKPKVNLGLRDVGGR